jgi:peptide/nickel transport system substrate-binding protein
MAENGRCSGRRSLMRRIALTALATAAMAFTAHAQAPRKGGTLRMTAPYGTTFSALDIHTSVRAQDGIWAKAIHRTLFNWDSAKNEIVGELVTNVTTSADGLTHTLKLRNDAFFHHGRQMSADDVIYSLTRLMDAKKAYAGARWARFIKGASDVEKGTAQSMDGLKKIDDLTLEMTLTEKTNPGFYFYNDNTAIYPKELADTPEFLQRPVGLGPFKFVEHVPSSRMVTERFDKFYKPVYLDKVIIAIMSEAPARDIAFRNKEVDLSILGPAQYVAYSDDPALKTGIIEVAEVFTRSMGMNPAFKPFSDKRVRQAVNHAIDTDLIVKRLAKNKAYRAVSWLPLTSPAFDKDRKSYAFDPDKAKKLLEEAGYKDGFEFEWTTSQNESWGLPVVEAVIPMLAKVGIKVKVKQIETAVLADTIRKNDFQAYIWSNQTGPDAMAVMNCFYSTMPQTNCNYVSFKNAAYDKLIDDARLATDPAKQNAILKQADGILYDEAHVWFFNYNKAAMAFQPWVKGLQANATELTHQYPEFIWVTDQSPVK